MKSIPSASIWWKLPFLLAAKSYRNEHMFIRRKKNIISTGQINTDISTKKFQILRTAMQKPENINKWKAHLLILIWCTCWSLFSSLPSDEPSVPLSALLTKKGEGEQISDQHVLVMAKILMANGKEKFMQELVRRRSKVTLYVAAPLWSTIISRTWSCLHTLSSLAWIARSSFGFFSWSSVLPIRSFPFQLCICLYCVWDLQKQWEKKSKMTNSKTFQGFACKKIK